MTAIIISTGRCGSTLLSDLIVEEPETLSVQEFFMGLTPPGCPDVLMDGADYWRILSSPRPDLVTLIRLGLPPKELHYPSTGRWAGDMANLPRILAVTASKLTDDPDSLFDQLAPRVPAFPRQHLRDHHQMFLDLLTTLTGRRRWVERSGGSSNVAPYLLSAFPHAKFVYLTRNWADTAQSMSRHPSFQLLQVRVDALGRYGIDPFNVAPGQTVPAELEPFLPENLTAEALRERGQDVRRYFGLCAFLSSQADQALADARPAQLLTMRYEDLVEDPVAELGRLGEFLEFADPAGWAGQVAGRVKSPVRA